MLRGTIFTEVLKQMFLNCGKQLLVVVRNFYEIIFSVTYFDIDTFIPLFFVYLLPSFFQVNKRTCGSKNQNKNFCLLFFFNLLTTYAPLIYEPVNRFALQIS